ncbi:complement factor B-like isoform X1 [Acipenser ruthenus]|uniref:complement factor B-like isoform X1 n=1 Tax=Acipenser ruthenus TaxID=7906 RepID=UPI002741693F|nr:complement factor B-like isoform X1 [Acipenser ruthenus]
MESDRAVGLFLVLCCIIINPVLCETLCNELVKITHGEVRYPVTREVGSVLKYLCPNNTRAFPVSWRVCMRNGQWSPLRNSFLERARTASCVPYSCSGHISLENGRSFPRRTKFSIGSTVHFECDSGFNMFGSPNRTCLATGKWSGKVTICDSGETFCPNPGIPLGGQRIGTRFWEGQQVRYTCYRGMVLRGPELRTCRADGSWTGTEPRCEERFSFDEPEAVGKHLNMAEEVITNTDKGIHMYFVVKVSASIGKENIEKAQQFVEATIEKYTDYSKVLRSSVVIFASTADEIMALKDNSPDDLDFMKFLNHTGCNTGEALSLVLSSIKENLDRKKPAKQVILLITNGRHNMGPSPYALIQNITEIIPEPTKNLDIFTIGIGDASKEELDRIASQRQEPRSFYLPDYEALEKIYPEENPNACGVRGVKGVHYGRVYKGTEAGQQQWPWQAFLKITGKMQGGGSIIADRWILTAAHVLVKSATATYDPSEITVYLGITQTTLQGLHGNGMPVEKVFVHKDYVYSDDDSTSQIYAHDVGLLKLNRTIKYSDKRRPVCLPCTEELSEILSLPNLDWTKQCQYQDRILTGNGGEDFRTVTGYISGWGGSSGNKATSRKLLFGEISIKGRDICSKSYPFPLPVPDDRFCAIGEDVDACGGDSGGPFVIKTKGRWIQVGIVSHGSATKCMSGTMGYYASVPKHMDWIRQQLDE